MDDRGTGHLGQLARGDEGGEGRRADDASGLIHHEAAVGVAVERESDIGALSDHSSLQVDQVGRLDRVGLVVGEGAVELEVHRHDVERKRGKACGIAENGGKGVAAHAVAGIDDHPKSAPGQRDQVAQELRVGHEHVLRRDRALRPERFGRMLQQRVLKERTDLCEP